MNTNSKRSDAYLVGFDEQDITFWEDGIQLMGWGITSNVARSVAAPLMVRTMFVSEPSSNTSFCYACVDLSIVSHLIRRRVLGELSRVLGDANPIHEHNLMLTATHTHSAPSGLTDFILYNLSGPGISEPCVQGVVQGIVTSIVTAVKAARPATLRWAEVDVPLSTPIAFNRSMKAHRNNPGVSAHASREESVRRVFSLLRADGLDGAALGALTFFPTHSTCVHSEHTVIHPDHKGLAATTFSRSIRASAPGSTFVGIFAQEAAGDVTPNFRYSTKRRRFIGAHDDDFKSVELVADAQAELAARAYRAAATIAPLPVRPILAALRRQNLAELDLDIALTHEPGATCGEPVMGVGFMEGTLEGPGPLLMARPALRRATAARRAWQRHRASARHSSVSALYPQGNKLPFLETGRGRNGLAFGLVSLRRPPLPDWFDASVRRYRGYIRDGAIDDGPWTPRATSSQLIDLGGVLIAGVSGEATTVAGQRIRSLLQSERPDATAIIVSGYANSYNSYIVTPDEYDIQAYEGAGTLFGRHTLTGYMQVLRDLARTHSTFNADSSPGSSPWSPSVEIAALRAYCAETPMR